MVRLPTNFIGIRACHACPVASGAVVWTPATDEDQLDWVSKDASVDLAPHSAPLLYMIALVRRQRKVRGTTATAHPGSHQVSSVLRNVSTGQGRGQARYC